MHDCALGIIFSQDKKKILLLQRKDVPVWVLPGGGIDPGETPVEAVVREVYEETGLSVKIVRHAAHFTPIRWLTNTAHVFECAVVEGLLQHSEEASAIAYFDLENLPSGFFDYHREWLNAVLQQPESHIQHKMSHRTFWKIIAYYLRHPLWALRFLKTRLSLRLGFFD